MDNKILVSFDIRGIQDYIFRTSKVKSLRLASKQVENALNDALKVVEEKQHLKIDFDWYKLASLNDGYYAFDYNDNFQEDGVVLYIGGGNGYLIFNEFEKANKVTYYTTKYILEKYNSILSVAVASIVTSDNYYDDMNRLRKKMEEVKDSANNSRFLEVLPISKIEKESGNPEKEKERVIFEKEEEEKIRKFDTYRTKKGVDSTIAVVHADGNSMADRIRKLMENETNYKAAIEKMRQISFSISHGYKDAFEKMANELNKDKDKPNVLKILQAGDDITYICNGKVALESVKQLTENVFDKFLYKDSNKSDEENNKIYSEYRFSICAGIAYIGAHFPFSIAYDVAEACCASAKVVAKANKKKIEETEWIPNYMDYQFCKSVSCTNLIETRESEYDIFDGTKLINRPYCVDIDDSNNNNNNLSTLRKYITNIQFVMYTKLFN